MAIHVIQSQRIDVLLQGMAKTVHVTAQNPFAVLATQHFIVPNAAVNQWLTEKLSELQGIHANYQFHQRIRGFQWFAYQQVLSEHKEQVRKANIPKLIIKWRIYQAMLEYIEPEHLPLEPSHPLYPIIERIYHNAEALQQPQDRQLKKQRMLYWVAEQVSQLFSNYMAYRGYCQKQCQGKCQCTTNWLTAWGENRALNVEGLIQQRDQQISGFQLQQAQELEGWQRWLWHAHFHQDFLDMVHIDELFWQQFASLDTQKLALQRLPAQVVVFTLLDLPPSQLQFLRQLGQYIDVYILHYNPSQEYWADSVDPLWKQRYDVGVKERYIQKYPKATDQEIANFFEQFTLHFNAESRESRHPLLTRLGKQARDHFSLLSNLSTGEEGLWVDAFVDDFPETLLGKIQSDILHLAEPQTAAYVLNDQDDSIQIHVCHSGLRQLETLRDQLIYWLADSKAAEVRKPSDILVLTPNLKAIEPLIRSVFPAVPNDGDVFLPVKISGVAQLDVLNAWRAVLGRIQLLQGRFNYDDFADWLMLSATQMCYALDDRQVTRMLALLADAGFKRGFDDLHLQHMLSQDDQDYRYSFKFALDRLALGIAMPVHDVFQNTLSYADVQADDFELIGKLIQIYQQFADRRQWMTAHQQGQQVAVEVWLKRLMAEVLEFEQAGVVALKVAREAIKKQERMVTLASFYGDAETRHLRQIRLPLPYLLDEIQNTLESQTAQAEPTGQITFSQIGQIRPLPYRLVVMLNLDQGQFPNRDARIPFDLMDMLRPQLGDRSRLEDDQGAFLDAMLLAKDNFWLFYNGFDVNDGEAREPSSVVQEFKSHLATLVQPKVQSNEAQSELLKQLDIPVQLASIYRVNSLQPFDLTGFDAEYSIQRYQDHWFQVAQNIQHPKGYRQAWVNTALEPDQTEIQVMNSQQWITDICFPAQLYLKTLGVENLKYQSALDQEEPLFLNGLAKYSIRDFLQKQQADASEQLLLDQLPVSKIKNSAWQQSVFEQTQLRERLQQYAAAETPTTHRIWRITSQLHMNIQLPVQQVTDWVSVEASSARAKRIARVWLEYLIWLAYSASINEVQPKRRIVVFSDQTVICEGLQPQLARDYLQFWLQAADRATREPLVLPAALMLKPLEKNKRYEWQSEDSAAKPQLIESDKLNVLKDWTQFNAFSTFDITQDESSQYHRDWAFILQEQDAKALLEYALEHFSADLYAPIYEYVHLE